MRYTKEKRVFMVTKYHRFQSSLKVQQAWDKKYPGEKSPTARTILANVKKFKETGSIQDLPHIFTKVNEQRESAKKQLIDLIHEFPKLSVRKAASAVNHSGNNIAVLKTTKTTIFNRMALHLTKQTASKTISSPNLATFSSTRQNGRHVRPI